MRNVYGDPSKIDAATLRRYVDFFYGEGTRAAIGKKVPTLDFSEVDTDVLKTLDVPALVLWDARNRWIPTAHAAEFASRIPRAKSVMDAGAHPPPSRRNSPHRNLASITSSSHR
ncbi:alpha/beta fold hydrolase [Paraburkholderia fynbosensis]|uniref:Uncharacterized protein n=1 Tax=Paraburkholderia fynbosensis TaxID=1200993 RepID=A0A6J5H0H1_9BURK|nr:hypothetical protein [Paraburkholderia fynbosensis]CAB3808315.1 hypothetical protein LMG27177_06529 [Paraburkholderia fynbosensis]